MSFIGRSLNRNFLAGLIITIPFGLTALILFKLGKWVVQVLSVAPANFIKPLAMLPSPWFEITTFAVGFSGTIFIVLVLGALARNFIGGKLIGLGESIIARIPLARTIYTATKQIIETLFLDSAFKGFKHVVMIEYPRKGIYSLGFLTSSVELGEYNPMPGKNFVGVFIPTSPNPTSGYYTMIPEEDVTELSIGTEDAFKIIMSIGLAANQGGESIFIKKNNS